MIRQLTVLYPAPILTFGAEKLVHLSVTRRKSSLESLLLSTFARVAGFGTFGITALLYHKKCPGLTAQVNAKHNRILWCQLGSRGTYSHISSN